MVFLFLASVLLAISTLAAPGPVDSVFYNNAVEVPDASGLYASVPSNTAACLTCQCNIDCPDECGCGTQTNPSPPTPPTLTNSAPAPKQYCEDLGAPGCPFRCRNGICYCYSYCSRNTCEVKLNGVVQKEGICAPAVVGTCLRYCIAHCDEMAQQSTETPYCRKLVGDKAAIDGSGFQIADISGGSGTTIQGPMLTPALGTDYLDTDFLEES